MVNSTWDGWIILARVSQIREIFPDGLDDPMPGSSSNSPYAQRHILDRRLISSTIDTAIVEKPADEDEHAGHHHGHAH